MNIIEIKRIKEAIELLNKALENRAENEQELEKAKYILEDLIEFKDFTISEETSGEMDI